MKGDFDRKLNEVRAQEVQAAKNATIDKLYSLIDLHFTRLPSASPQASEAEKRAAQGALAELGKQVLGLKLGDLSNARLPRAT